MFFGKKKDSSEAWSKSAGEESRKFPRLGMKTIIDVEVIGRKAHCKLSDVSLGGLAFIAPWEIAPPAKVWVQIPPPEGLGVKKSGPAKIEGVACRCVRDLKRDGWQVGIRFTDVPPDAQGVIELWFETFGESAIPREEKPRSKGGSS